MLEIPAISGESNYIRVDDNFAAIFTSNPEEYAGVHKAQDALRDRLITIDLGHFDRDTELSITTAKAKMAPDEAAKIVDLVREFRQSGEYEFTPTVRAPIKIGRVLSSLGLGGPADTNGLVRDICYDVLTSEIFSLRSQTEQKSDIRQHIDELVDKHIYNGGAPSAG